MDKYSKHSEVPLPDVPPWPKKCMECDSETTVAHICVYDDSGKTHTGSFSNFGYRQGREFHLQKPYTFAHWRTLCASCMSKRSADRKEILRKEWERLGKPRTKEDCMKVMYECNPAMARLIGRGQ